MSEIVTDAEGQTFEVHISRGSGTTLTPFGGWSLRNALGRAASVRDILDDDGNRSALTRALVEARMVSPGEAQSLTHRDVRAMAEEAFSSGTFGLSPYRRNLRPVCDINATAPAEQLADELEEVQEARATHTLELELVDDDDEPVAGEPYRVELPSGEVVQGRLNAQGRALLTNIAESGNCTVTFPRLDESAWAPA